MTRFDEEYLGFHGAFWQGEAQKAIAKMESMVERGEVLLDRDGGAYWKSSGKYLPEECLNHLEYTGVCFDFEATRRGRDLQTAEALRNYRYTPSDEDIAEMTAAFGKGTTVVDIITGRTIKL